MCAALDRSGIANRYEEVYLSRSPKDAATFVYLVPHDSAGTILHLADPNGAPCQQRYVPFTDRTHWSALDFSGLWNMDREEWNLEYEQAQVGLDLTSDLTQSKLNLIKVELHRI